MIKFLFNQPAERREDFRRLSECTGLPVAEAMRRMHDYCLQDSVLDRLFPNLSGTVTVAERRRMER